MGCHECCDPTGAAGPLCNVPCAWLPFRFVTQYDVELHAPITQYDVELHAPITQYDVELHAPITQYDVELYQRIEQYDVELYQRIEQLLATTLDIHPCEEPKVRYSMCVSE